MAYKLKKNKPKKAKSLKVGDKNWDKFQFVK